MLRDRTEASGLGAWREKQASGVGCNHLMIRYYSDCFRNHTHTAVECLLVITPAVHRQPPCSGMAGVQGGGCTSKSPVTTLMESITSKTTWRGTRELHYENTEQGVCPLRVASGRAGFAVGTVSTQGVKAEGKEDQHHLSSKWGAHAGGSLGSCPSPFLKQPRAINF